LQNTIIVNHELIRFKPIGLGTIKLIYEDMLMV